MPALARDLSQVEIQAFPPWLDLPPGYIVNDWIAWEKGKLVAQRQRQDPSLIQHAIERLESRGDSLFDADAEWLELLRQYDVNQIATVLESSDHDGQRLRSSTPFCRPPFVQPDESEAIREKAYLG